MKITFKILPFLLIITSLSCDRLFPDFENELELIDTQEEVISALNGAYGKFREAMIYHNFFTIRSDDMNLRKMDYECYEEGEMPVDVAADFYRLMYKSVIMCNRLIYDVTNYERNGELDPLLGEAYFLRAYIYFKLVRIYGKIPLVDNIDVSYDLELPTFRELYTFIAEDLLEAEVLLPANSSSVRITGVTPHAGVAKALLAEVYLTTAGYPVEDHQMYGRAAEIAGEVIDQAAEYGFSLCDDFAALWSWDGHTHPESMLRYYFEPDLPNPGYRWFSEKWWSFGPATTIAYYNNFPYGYRKEVTLATRYVDIRDYEIDSVIFSDYVMVDVDTSTLCRFYSKCFGKKQTWNFQTNLIYSNLTFEAYSDWYYRHIYWDYRDDPLKPPFSTYFHLLRYAQTLLTYAEASARSGGPDSKAYEALNQVRRRAAYLDVHAPSDVDIVTGSLTSQQFADSVVAERAWELCHEFEGRWFDILRLQLLDDVDSDASPGDLKYHQTDDLYQGNQYYVPLPQVDLWLNPNLEETD